MSSTNTLLCCALLVGAAVAHADVTILSTTAGKASIMNVGGTSTNLIKGNRMRTDSLLGKRRESLIIDIDNKRFVSIDDKKKTATVTALASITGELEKVGISDLQATLKSTGQVKNVAGYSCTVHDLGIEMPFSLTGDPGDGMDATMVLAGTVCLSKDAPGLAEYQKFYRASADSGFIFGDPRTAKAPPSAAQAQAYAAITRKMAEAGIALESHVTITSKGHTPVAEMMAKFGASDITMTVTQITAGDLPAEQFDVPAGYKVKEN